MKPNNVIEITKEHKAESTWINSLSATLRRFSSSLGFGISPDGKRNYNELYGYGETLSYADYYGMYKRGGLAHVVAGKVAKACWNQLPKIMIGDTQILEDELDQLSNMGFFRKMERADILNRIGKFSVLLIGMPDGQDLNQPVGQAKDIQGLYFNPYNCDGIEITKWDMDPVSQRYGLPELYQLQTTSFGDSTKDMQKKAIVVHWSRVVHLAEGALDSSIEGASALEPVFNALTDLNKVRGGSGEAYFRNARQQRALEADKDARLEKGSTALADLKSNIEDFDNAWDSTLRLQNMTAKHMQVQMISPRDTFDVIVEEISGQTGIPVRILTGKGAGQLAGSEDRASWNALIIDRQSSECDGYLLAGLSIMSEAGMFELPDNATIEWPEQQATTEKEAAESNKTKAETLKLVVEAMNLPVGDELESESVFKAVGLEDIEGDFSAIDDSKVDDLDDHIDEPDQD